MVELGVLEDLQEAAAGAVLGGGAAEDDALHPHMDQRAGAHGAGFLGHVEMALVQSPVAQDAFRLGNGQHFRVRCGIVAGQNRGHWFVPRQQRLSAQITALGLIFRIRAAFPRN